MNKLYLRPRLPVYLYSPLCAHTQSGENIITIGVQYLFVPLRRTYVARPYVLRDRSFRAWGAPPFYPGVFSTLYGCRCRRKLSPPHPHPCLFLYFYSLFLSFFFLFRSRYTRLRSVPCDRGYLENPPVFVAPTVDFDGKEEKNRNFSVRVFIVSALTVEFFLWKIISRKRDDSTFVRLGFFFRKNIEINTKFYSALNNTTVIRAYDFFLM